MEIEIARGLGDNPGSKITSKYFDSELVFTQIGRVAIDKSEKGLKNVSLTLGGIRKSVRPGLVLRMIDGADEYRMKKKSTLYRVGRDTDGRMTASTSITVRMLKV